MVIDNVLLVFYPTSKVFYSTYTFSKINFYFPQKYKTQTPQHPQFIFNWTCNEILISTIGPNPKEKHCIIGGMVISGVDEISIL
tara:strand:+ start:244 stop:495 length:252 start_codon:yes stop_codon:yes gene_type:complete